MAGRPLHHLLHQLRRAAAPAGGATDADLLGRFADGRDEAAFETLVWRHGPLVYGVCRRVLGHAADAEDAFQAAFLVLARKAGAVRRRSAVGPWLYRVAQRVALRARASRGTHEVGRRQPPGHSPSGRALDRLEVDQGVDTPRSPDGDPVAAAVRRELRHILDDEIARLPARYRAAVVLRYLEGRTTAEAAAALGCPPGTVLSRLAWARRRLRVRLAARGAALPAALAAVATGEAAGAVPARWVAAAVGAAGAFAAGGRAGRPAALAAEVLRAMWMTRLRVGAVVVFGALAAGAGLLVPGTSPGRADKRDQPAPPAVEVTVVRPTRRTTGEVQDYAGRAEPSASVDVRSRITSPIEKVAFRPGAKVKRGDLLFELDARAYQVECDRARAEVQRAESQVRGADVNAARVKRLRELANAAAEEGDRAQTAVDEARANLLVAKAGLQRAQLDLDATRIAAPIDGQTGGATLTAGNLATPTSTLVVIVAADPIYVYFDVPEREVPALQKLLQRGAVTVLVGLAGDTGFPRRGTIEFVDNRVKPKTGTVGVRAALPNPTRDILPGMFVRVRVTAGEPREELLVPCQAVTRIGGDPSFVLVAGRDNVIEWRPVSIGEQVGDQYVVTAGLGRDDRVVTSSLGTIKPGAAIHIHESGGGK